jgi:hypothetical protein
LGANHRFLSMLWKSLASASFVLCGNNALDTGQSKNDKIAKYLPGDLREGMLRRDTHLKVLVPKPSSYVF